MPSRRADTCAWNPKARRLSSRICGFACCPKSTLDLGLWTRDFCMQRRDFLSAGTAGLAASILGGYFVSGQDQKKRRVGLIGCGWYGKSDICRLIQVSPVEVVSLCDVDKHMLKGAAELIASRQSSKKEPRTFGDYREMLKEKNLDIV